MNIPLARNGPVSRGPGPPEFWKSGTNSQLAGWSHANDPRGSQHVVTMVHHGVNQRCREPRWRRGGVFRPAAPPYGGELSGSPLGRTGILLEHRLDGSVDRRPDRRAISRERRIHSHVEEHLLFAGLFISTTSVPTEISGKVPSAEGFFFKSRSVLPSASYMTTTSPGPDASLVKPRAASSRSTAATMRRSVSLSNVGRLGAHTYVLAFASAAGSTVFTVTPYFVCAPATAR